MRTITLSLLLLLPLAAPFSVNCFFGYDYRKHFDDKVYKCSIKKGVIATPHTKITKVHGNPKPSMEEVKYLEVKAPAEFLYMPDGFEQFFPDLKGIHITDANLRVIKKENLQPFPNLIVAYFNGNHLIELDGNLFANNKKLKAISFRDNSIRKIDLRLFDGLNELVQVKFSNNVCIREGGNGEGPDEIKDVESLILDHCQEKEDPDLGAAIEKLRDQIASLSAQLGKAEAELAALTKPTED